MDIQPNRVYPNKTKTYLTPALKDWGDEFQNRIYRLPKLAWGIADYGSQSNLDDNLYCLVHVDGSFKEQKYRDSAISRSKFSEFLQWFSNGPFYYTDYEFDGLDGDKHMIVIRLPEEHSGITTRFVEGKYSQLYSQEAIERLIDKTRFEKKIEYDNDIYLILTKDKRYREKFRNKLKLDFQYNHDIREDIELEYPPILKQEIFNYDRI